jgi:hypothetical protein
MSGPQSRSGLPREDKNRMPLLGIYLWFLGLPAHSLVASQKISLQIYVYAV